MGKKVKMVLYGAPGVGKSTFAAKAPNPLFICSDGNFEWLDLPEENGIEVSSWKEAKDLFANKELLGKYDTIVLDLTEDLFKWCEAEFVQKNKLEHIGDLGYGKGYQITRDCFFIEISKLIAMDKNVIMIMHETTVAEKDRRGVEHTKHLPSSRMPDKLYDMIEGRVRYFLRCYIKEEEIDEGHFVKKRFLSLVPKPNEFGIARGLDESAAINDISLDWDEFIKAIGLDKEEPIKKKENPAINIKEEIKKKKLGTKEESKVEEIKKEASVEEKKSPKATEEKQIEKVEEVPLKVEEKIIEKKEETFAKKELTNEEKIAEIKAKLAALKK